MKIKDFITPTTVITLIMFLMAIGGYKFLIADTVEKVKINTEKITYIDRDVIILKTELPIIKEDIKDIKVSQDEIQKDIKLLLRQSRVQ